MPVPRLVDDLRAELTGPVTLHETHASWVLVGDREALKVKKPVVMPFLDYGTLERRKAACLLEVELNRRLAPAIYLGAVAIVPAGSGVALRNVDDPGAVEYAVRMRRYAEDDTLASRLARGAVSASEIERIGERIARFHADVPAVATDAGAEPVRRWLDDTFASLRGLTHNRRHRGLLTGAERLAAAFMTARWDELERRAASGRVRDGHGDLRAEHVLLAGGDIVVVDCIEFEPQLRQIDVASDLAFLVMDLHASRRGDLATTLVGAYRAAGGDAGDDMLIAWLASYRALVRAKVMLLRAAQQSTEAAERSQATANRLLGVAERFVWQARGPVTVAVGGLSASGKTTLANALAQRAGLPYLSSDVARKRGAGLAPAQRGDPALYAPEVSRRLYAQLGACAAQQPGGAIVDATFRRIRERAAFRDGHGAARSVLYVECVAPVALRVARAHARQRSGGGASDAGPDVVRRQTMDALDELAPNDHSPYAATDRWSSRLRPSLMRWIGRSTSLPQLPLSHRSRTAYTSRASPRSPPAIRRAGGRDRESPADRWTDARRAPAAACRRGGPARGRAGDRARRSKGIPRGDRRHGAAGVPGLRARAWAALSRGVDRYHTVVGWSEEAGRRGPHYVQAGPPRGCMFAPIRARAFLGQHDSVAIVSQTGVAAACGA